MTAAVLSPTAGRSRVPATPVAPAPAVAAGDSVSIAGNLLSADPLAALEARRAALGIEISSLCEAAGVPERTYRWWRAGSSQPPRPALQRLGSALDRLAGGRRAAGGLADLIATALGAVEAMARLILPADVAEGLPGHVAIWAVNQFGGVRQADLAAHRGLSRPAIHLAIRRVESLREADPGFEAALARLTRDAFAQEA